MRSKDVKWQSPGLKIPLKKLDHEALFSCELLGKLFRLRSYVYSCLVDELCVFDAAGQLRDRQEAEGNIEAALDLLDTLGVESITKAVIKVRRIMPQVLAYFEVAEEIVAELQQQVGASVQESMPSPCL